MENGLRKIRWKTSESERPHVLLLKLFPPLYFGGKSEFRTCSERSDASTSSAQEFFEIFFDSLDFFFVTFFCIKAKESKVL
jgi:hypothetical protein